MKTNEICSDVGGTEQGITLSEIRKTDNRRGS